MSMNIDELEELLQEGLDKLKIENLRRKTNIDMKKKLDGQDYDELTSQVYCALDEFKHSIVSYLKHNQK